MKPTPINIFFTVFIAALVSACFIFPPPSSNSVRATGIEFITSPEPDEDVENILDRPFQSNRNTLIPPKNVTVWLKIPIPTGIRAWSEGAILYSGSNESVLSMQGYLVTDDKITDLGYCDTGLQALTCKISTLQYSFKLDQVDVYKKTHLYLKVLPGFNAIHNEFYFMEPGYFNKVVVFILFALGVGCGLGILTVLLAGIFYLSFKELSFLIYGILYCCLLIAATFARGLYDLYKPPDWISAASIILPLSYLVFTLDLLFLKTFFETSKNDKKVNWFLNGFIGFFLVIIVLTQVHSLKVFLWQMRPYAVFLAQIVETLALIYFIYKKRNWAIPFTVAWSMVIIFTVVWILFRNGGIDGPWYFGYYVILGRILELLILNFILYGKLKSFMKSIITAKARNEESRMVKALLRMLSHDLSSTTQLIQLGANLSLESNNKDEINKNLKTILSATKAQSDMISQAKSNYLAHPDELLRVAPVDLNVCIDEIATLYQYRFQKKDVELIVETEATPLMVMGEPTSLTHQILGNLIGNALKYTLPGKRIYLKAKILNEEKAEVLVQDEGVGMDDEKMHSIFKESSIDKNGTASDDRNGHGLLIVNDFVKAIGAKITVESKLGQGTTFRILLKRAVSN